MDVLCAKSAAAAAAMCVWLCWLKVGEYLEVPTDLKEVPTAVGTRHHIQPLRRQKLGTGTYLYI